MKIKYWIKEWISKLVTRLGITQALLYRVSVLENKQKDHNFKVDSNYYELRDQLNSLAVGLKDLSEKIDKEIAQQTSNTVSIANSLNFLNDKVDKVKSQVELELEEIITPPGDRWKIVGIIGENDPGVLTVDIGKYTSDGTHIPTEATKRVSVKILPKIRQSVNRLLAGQATDMDYSIIEMCSLPQ